MPLDTADTDRQAHVDQLAEQFKRARIENAILNEKLTQLGDELRQATLNVEQLDGEHAVAIDEVLHMKEQLQRRCSGLETELAAARAAAAEHDDVRLRLAEATALNAQLADREREAIRNLDENTRLLTQLTAAWTEDKAQAEAQRHEHEAEKACWLGKVAGLRTELDALAADKLLAAGELQQAQLNDRRASGDELQLGALQRRVHELEADHHELTAELERLRSHGRVVQITDVDEAPSSDAVQSITLAQLADIIRPYAPPADPAHTDVVRHLRDTLASIDQFKFDLESLAEKHHQLGETNARVQHEKDTAQADLHHYELELAEVMKSNEVLLAELETAKAGGKLETISEQNEDNIIHLEQQLEDCSNLNQSLEDEYQDMRDRLATAEQRVHALAEALREQHERGEELTLVVDGAELRIAELNAALLAERELRGAEAAADDQRRQELAAELQSLQTRLEEASFELAEVRAAERPTVTTVTTTAATQASDVDRSSQLDELRAQVLCLSDAKAQLEQQLASVQLQAVASVEQATATIDGHVARAAADSQLIDKKSTDVRELLEQLQQLKAEHSSAIAELSASLGAAADWPLQQAELQQQLAAAAQQKADLVALVTTKHGEAVQYHEEVQRLSGLLHDEQTRQRECAACTATAVQLAALRTNTEAATAQATQLRQQTDVLAASLQAEQAAHQRAVRQLEQQRSDRGEQLADVQRLRTHLLEVEEAHTQEQMEMQQLIDQLQLKLAGLEQEARKSSTAYTSAR